MGAIAGAGGEQRPCIGRGVFQVLDPPQVTPFLLGSGVCAGGDPEISVG